MDGLRAGEAAALSALHDWLGATVHGYLRQALADAGAAEDVFQLVFGEVWRRGADFDPRRGSLTGWVMTIARSRAIDELRRRRPVPTDPARMPETAVESEQDALAERWRVAQLLRTLPDDERELLRLRFYEDLSQTEIAETTGVPLGTVKTRMVRGLERLQNVLSAERTSEATPLRDRRPRLAGEGT